MLGDLVGEILRRTGYSPCIGWEPVAEGVFPLVCLGFTGGCLLLILREHIDHFSIVPVVVPVAFIVIFGECGNERRHVQSVKLGVRGVWKSQGGMWDCEHWVLLQIDVLV